MYIRYCFVFVYFLFVVRSSGYIFDWGFQWRPLGHNMCPSEDPDTHECFQMLTQNRTCTSLVVRTCNDSETAHNGSMSKICVSVESRACTMYTCAHRGCCSGYIENTAGDCVLGDTPDQLQCENGGTFQTTTGTCACPVNFTGDRCKTPLCPEACQNGGRCELDDLDVPGCLCSSSVFTGHACQTVTCPSACLNGGECVADGVLAVCRCPEGFAGKTCEFTVDDKQCPPATTSVAYDNDCIGQGHCTTSSDCDTGRICCWDGSCGRCMLPLNETCYHGNGYLASGEIFRPDPCMVCVCQAWGEMRCDQLTCPAPTCKDGHTVVRIEGQCCGRCPEDSDLIDTEYEAPVMENCPQTFVVADVGWDSDVAVLPDLHLTARDFSGDPLEVHLDQTTFHHSMQADISYNTHIITAYSDLDRLGRRAECHLKVIVRDPFPPIFTSCPAEIFIMEEERVTWESPVAKDNIGIYMVKSHGDEIQNTALTPGTYPVTYTVWDFDQNEAICGFLIRVFATDSSKMPETLTNRKQRVGVSLGVVAAGVLVALAIFCFLAFLWYKTFRRRNSPHQRRPSASLSRDFDANIYAICGPPMHTYQNSMTLPKYSPPINPPSYDECNDPCVAARENPYVNTPSARAETKLGMSTPMEEPIYYNIDPEGMDEPQSYSNPAYINFPHTEVETKVKDDD